MIQNFLTLEKEDAQHNELHRKMFSFAQGVIDKKFTSVPTTKEVPVGYFAFYNSGTTFRIYVNFYGTMKYWTLT